jgi:hypothetical protein
VTLPVGAYDDEIRADESLPQTSSWASSGNSASCQLWTATTPRTQALDAQAAPTVIWTSKKTWGSTSSPPQRAGCSMRKKPASLKSAMVASGKRRRLSASARRSTSAGTRATARARRSSGVIVCWLMSLLLGRRTGTVGDARPAERRLVSTASYLASDGVYLTGIDL